MQIVDDRGLREDSNEYTFVARDFSLGLQYGMRVFTVAEKICIPRDDIDFRIAISILSFIRLIVRS